MSHNWNIYKSLTSRHGYEAQDYESEAQAKPRLWSTHKSEDKAENKALNFCKHEAEAEAEALAFSKHKAEAEAQALPSYYKYPVLLLITFHLLKFRQNVKANMIWNWKM